ncbi:MAG: hypothetical protein Q8R60_14385 [Mycobacteriales bacterium]|nr:hypothetical protein [Mycobacteriales bacterium]
MRTPLLVVALLAGTALTACQAVEKTPVATPTPTISQPPSSAFVAGTCSLAAEDVLAVGRDTVRLGDGGDGKVDPAVKDSLRETQDRLAPLAETADATAKAALDRLVVAIGLVRVRADGNTYEPALGQELRTAYDAAVLACTTG